MIFSGPPRTGPGSVGLIDVLFPSWHHGIPVVAHRAKKFDPEEAFHLIAKHKIRNAFMPPTALKLMRQVQDPKSRHSYRMRSIGSRWGETLGEELLDWGKEVMGSDDQRVLRPNRV